MHTIAKLTLTSALIALPFAQAQAASQETLDQVLSAADEYGVTEYQEIEFDDGVAEVDGWAGDEWFVEIDVESNGDISQEEREKRVDGPWGMSSDDIRAMVEAAMAEGMTRIDEIKANARGSVEVEGEDDNGRDLEVTFRLGSTDVQNVRHDD